MAAEILVGSLLLMAGAVKVEGTLTCPTAAAVEEQLAALLPPGAGEPDRAFIGGSETHPTLTLTRADGSAVVERQIDAQGSCTDLAGALALMVAVWHAQQHPTLPLAPRLPAPLMPPAQRLRLEAHTQVFASAAGPEVSPGARLSATLWSRRWGLTLSVSGTPFRERSLGRGQAAWTRGAVALGPARRLLARAINLDLHLSGLAGLTLGRGVGYPEDRSPTVWTFGASAGLDVSRVIGRFVLLAGLDGTVWRPQELMVDVSGEIRALPWAEIRAGGGLGFVFDL